MKLLIIYGTVEGQTRKIADFVAGEVARLGHDPVLIDAEDTGAIEFGGVGAVILAASVHQRRHPRSFEAMLAAHAADLSAVPVLMLSVSLNAAFAEGREEAEDYLTEMKMRTGLAPDVEMLDGGAVRRMQYDYFAMQVIRHVVMRDRPFDASKAEHEFTDWDAVAVRVAAFLDGIGGRDGA